MVFDRQTQLGLIPSILSAPDEDAPRLGYADWLEEQGDPLGELVRVQVEMLHPLSHAGARSWRRGSASCSTALASASEVAPSQETGPSAGTMTSPVETSRWHVAVRVPAVPDPHPSAGTRRADKGEGSAASVNEFAARWMLASR